MYTDTLSTNYDYDFNRFDLNKFLDRKTKQQLFNVKGIDLSASRKKFLKTLKKFAALYRGGDIEMPLAIEAIQYLKMQRQENQVTDWQQDMGKRRIM